MIKTLSPCSNTSKTAEIMSRYRPIAPKPEVDDGTSMSKKVRQSPYFRNLWPQLQARPTRTRKRGRAALSPPTIKRTRTHLLGLSSPCHVTSPAKHLSLDGFAHSVSHLPFPSLAGVNHMENPVATASTLVTLPLLPCPASAPVVASQATTTLVPAHELNCMEPIGENMIEPIGEKMIDLNMMAEIPEEKDLLRQLQEPPTTTTTPTNNVVIAPQPVRPVGSSISVRCINEDSGSCPSTHRVPKKPEEVEEEVESEALPAVISDSNNKVRLANSAYKEMVGQPECPWLESMVTGERQFGGKSSKRICGEVLLHLSDSGVPASSDGFSCWVKIEWETEGKRNSVDAFCDVIRLSCKSNVYVNIWRFHTPTREGSQSSCSNNA